MSIDSSKLIVAIATITTAEEKNKQQQSAEKKMPIRLNLKIKN